MDDTRGFGRAMESSKVHSTAEKVEALEKRVESLDYRMALLIKVFSQTATSHREKLKQLMGNEAWEESHKHDE